MKSNLTLILYSNTAVWYNGYESAHGISESRKLLSNYQHSLKYTCYTLLKDKLYVLCGNMTSQSIGPKGQGYRPNFSSYILIFWCCTAGLECAPIQLCRGGPAPQKFSMRATYVIKLSKAYKASNNVLKEIVKLT